MTNNCDFKQRQHIVVRQDLSQNYEIVKNTTPTFSKTISSSCHHFMYIILCIIYVIPRWPILLTFEKFRQIFLEIKPWRPPVRDMPRHKLEVIKPLIAAKEPVKT